MDEKQWEVVKEYRKNGVFITDREAEEVYGHCLRKMEFCRIGSWEEYLQLLYADEVRNYLFRRAVNATTMLRKLEKEGIA